MLDLNAKKEIAKEIIAAPSACPEIKAAAENYLNAAGTDAEAEAGKALVTECEECICTIDSVIGFFATDAAAGIFGTELAAQKLRHAKKIKDEGAVYCDCPACTAALKVIGNKADF